MTIATWTPERIDQLRNSVIAGLTCSQIAAEIGVTRNAIIGKIHRLGIGPGRGAGAPVRRRTVGASQPRTTSPRRALRLLRTHTEPAEAAAPEAIDTAQRCSLLDLAQGKCRWPISDPGKADFAFCGNTALAGESYCAGHARLAYRFAARRRA
jgi:GcrA cell cycle regulator